MGKKAMPLPLMPAAKKGKRARTAPCQNCCEEKDDEPEEIIRMDQGSEAEMSKSPMKETERRKRSPTPRKKCLEERNIERKNGEIGEERDRKRKYYH